MGANVKVKLDLSDCATKIDFKNATAVETLKFANKVDLANLSSNVDKLDIDKLKNVPTNFSNLKSKVYQLDADKLVPIPVDLSKLIDVAKNDVVKKEAYKARVKNIEDKTSDITNLATNTTSNAKINEVKKEIPSKNLTTTTAVTSVENKIPNVSDLVKKKQIMMHKYQR